MAFFSDPGPQGFGVGADRVDQFTPFGNVVFSDKNRRVATTTLSPAQRRLLEQREVAQQLLGDRAINMTGGLPRARAPVFRGLPDVSPLDARGTAVIGARAPGRLDTVDPTGFSRERNRVEKAQFGRMMALLNPEFDRQEGAMQQRLANQGLPQASRAYTAETGRFGDTRNQATEQAAMAATLAGGAEQSRMMQDMLAGNTAAFGQQLAQRQQQFGERQAGTAADLAQRQQLAQEQQLQRQLPLNELLAIMGLNQVGMPQFQQQAGANIAGAQMAQQNAAAKNALYGDLIGGAMGAGGAIGSGFMMRP